jgi:hypothetical protein
MIAPFYDLFTRISHGYFYPRHLTTLFVGGIILQSSLPFAQTLVVELYEKQDFVAYRNTSIDSTLMRPDYLSEIDRSKTKYVFDLTKKTSTFYREDEFASILPIAFEKISDNLLQVQILQESLDYGLLINLDPAQESVLWYGFSEFTTTVMKAHQFKLLKCG